MTVTLSGWVYRGGTFGCLWGLARCVVDVAFLKLSGKRKKVEFTVYSFPSLKPSIKLLEAPLCVGYALLFPF